MLYAPGNHGKTRIEVVMNGTYILRVSLGLRLSDSLYETLKKKIVSNIFKAGGSDIFL